MFTESKIRSDPLSSLFFKNPCPSGARRLVGLITPTALNTGEGFANPHTDLVW